MRREEIMARFKEKMRAGEVIVGIQHNSGSEAIVELIGYAGFDYVLIDMEHSGYSIADTERMVRAAEHVGIVAFVRVLKNDPHLIMQAMDTGAQGVFVPHITTRQECEAAIAAMHYIPKGIRGVCDCARAAGWGTLDMKAYQTWANSETLMVPIIEDKEAVDALEDILSAPGLELISVGPADLSQSFGMAGLGHKAAPVMAALERAVAFCAPRGIAVATIPAPGLTMEITREVIAKGAKVIWYGTELVSIGKLFKRIVVDVRSQ